MILKIKPSRLARVSQYSTFVSTDHTYHQTDKEFQTVYGVRKVARDNGNAIFDCSNAVCDGRDTLGDGSTATCYGTDDVYDDSYSTCDGNGTTCDGNGAIF